MKKNVTLIAWIMGALMMSSSAFAVGNGSTPPGKPFVNLQSQIYDLRDTVELLEDQITVNNNTIADLEATAALLQTAIANNVGNIANYQEDLNDVQMSISLLQNDIIAIQNDLDLKQNIITGTCPLGEVLREIYPDGSVACEESGITPVVGSLYSFRVYNSKNVNPGDHETIYQACPSGTVITGGGFYGYTMNVYGSYKSGGNSWYIFVQNTSPYYNRNIYVFATCSYVE